MRNRILGLCCLAFSVVARSHAQTAAPFKIIVNTANAVSALSRDDAAKLFLRKTDTWSTGAHVIPVDQNEDAAVRHAFSAVVLQKDVSSVRSYWRQVIFSGRGIPPAEKNSDSDVTAYVADNPTAIGYVSGGATLRPGVKAGRIDN